MKRTYKFLVMIQDWDDFDYGTVPKDIVSNYYYASEAFMTVLECHHEKWEDNLVAVNEYGGDQVQLVKTARGNYYYWEDVWSKTDVINAFE